jgi:nucleoside-diphosphate-sugar epimerase
VGVRLIVESPVNTIETNIKGTENVLMLANKKKKKVFIASTSEVYGKSVRVPFKEDDDLVLGPTVKGRWSYACSKALDEFLAIAYWKERRLPVVIARFFNVVGPRQTGRYGMVLPNFIKAALKDEPIRVFGDGRQTRNFTYVTDCIETLVRLLESQKPQASKILIKAAGRLFLVNQKDIGFASIEEGVITVVTSGANGIEGQSNCRTLEELLDSLDPNLFWRAHRSYLVNINRIKEVVPWFKSSYQLRMDDKKHTEIPVSRVQTKRLRELLKL